MPEPLSPAAQAILRALSEPADGPAVLARWGNHSPGATEMVPPPEGEVAELVAWLREEAAEQSPGDSDGLPSDVRDCLADATARLTRAAELLERQAAPVPVPAPAGEVEPDA